uniref:GPI inositol-deacylase n=1 Tax=Bionectria ochroleuca TaxID=29856 RepID=A0A8H7KAK1_BIOOC
MAHQHVGQRRWNSSRDVDPRIKALGRTILDDYAAVREEYGTNPNLTAVNPIRKHQQLTTSPATPTYPIVLAHGLLGFSEIKLAQALPSLQYWHGIQDALEQAGATVITATRAASLRDQIAAARPSAVNIVAHSMGGLDARYLASCLAPDSVAIKSITTIATPHRGSHFADFLMSDSAPIHLPGSTASSSAPGSYMTQTFNATVRDRDDVRYFSYGAMMDEPALLSPFRQPWRLIEEAEGPNGLVSVESSRWGTYKGTLVGVSHLDLINWSNRVRWTVREWMGVKRTFNAIAFYLDIADMLAKEGL